LALLPLLPLLPGLTGSLSDLAPQTAQFGNDLLVRITLFDLSLDDFTDGECLGALGISLEIAQGRRDHRIETGNAIALASPDQARAGLEVRAGLRFLQIGQCLVEFPRGFGRLTPELLCDALNFLFERSQIVGQLVALLAQFVGRFVIETRRRRIVRVTFGPRSLDGLLQSFGAATLAFEYVARPLGQTGERLVGCHPPAGRQLLERFLHLIERRLSFAPRCFRVDARIAAAIHRRLRAFELLDRFGHLLGQRLLPGLTVLLTWLPLLALLRLPLLPLLTLLPLLPLLALLSLLLLLLGLCQLFLQVAQFLEQLFGIPLQ
jgi:hypothetical protein